MRAALGDDRISQEFARMAEERDRELEDFLGTLRTAAAGVVLNMRGQVTLTETDRYHPPPNLAPLRPAFFTASLTELGPPGGGNVTVEVRKNGVAVASLTPSASPGLHWVALTEMWNTADFATIAVTAFRAGARGLVAGLA